MRIVTRRCCIGSGYASAAGGVCCPAPRSFTRSRSSCSTCPIQHAASRSSERTRACALPPRAAHAAPVRAWDRRKLGPCDGSVRRRRGGSVSSEASPPRDDWRARSARRRCPCPGAVAPFAASARSSPLTRSPARARRRCSIPPPALGRRAASRPSSRSATTGSGQRPVRLRVDARPAVHHAPHRPRPPTYRDATDPTSFILGAEDLVPVLDESARRQTTWTTTTSPLRPRRPPLPPADRGRRSRASSAGRATSRILTTSTGARSRPTTCSACTAATTRLPRRATPRTRSRVFSWLIWRVPRRQGQCRRVRLPSPRTTRTSISASAHERRALDDASRRSANRYLNRVRYGNAMPLLDADWPTALRSAGCPDRDRRAGCSR